MAKIRDIPHYEFLKKFPDQNIKPIYYIFGPETYLKDQVLKKISSKFKDLQASDFDSVTFHADTNSAIDVVEQLEMLPFLAKYRFIVLKNFDSMSVSDKNLIAEYSKNPVSSSILVLTAEKIDERIKANKTIIEKALKIICRSPYNSSDILRWLRDEVREKKITMDTGSMEFFSQSIEFDYQIAANELEKLIIYTKGKSRITLDDVKDTVGRSRTNKVYDLQNELGKRNLQKSLTILENMIANNESAVFIIIMLSNFFQLLWRINALQKNNITNSEIERRYIPEILYRFRKNNIGYAQNYSFASLRKIFALLLQADIDAKSLNLKDAIILETLIYRICKS
ncbi:MAG: DNA polymerase III subunit delta [Candidatus Cloacimonetes bacterium]|nr:DNA polymerase III subunit delta [Candidatus Cloacimonadota bacterium]